MGVAESAAIQHQHEAALRRFAPARGLMRYLGLALECVGLFFKTTVKSSWTMHRDS
jgi:hypothetical protein